MKVYVPRIEDKESHMRMLHITNTEDDLIANHMNILEPTLVDSTGNPRDEGILTSSNRTFSRDHSAWNLEC